MNVFKLPVHPAADVFPMLSDEELADLVADIKTNGLLQPIIVKDGVLIDGRNRREACRLAGVEPHIEELNGTDPVAYILATNIQRRHMTKGQRAMAVARIYPEPEKGGRGKKSAAQTSEKIGGFSRDLLDQARTVLAVLPQVADAVLAGSKSLSEAYAEAQTWKASQDSEVMRFARLRERAPDLAELVDEGRMTLAEAESAFAVRVSEERRERQAVIDVIDGLNRHLDFFADGSRRARLVAVVREVPDERRRIKTLLQQWLTNLAETEALV